MADEDRESRIRARAHRLWEQAGGGDGSDLDHWSMAEREIDAEDGGRPAGSGQEPRSAKKPKRSSGSAKSPA